MIGREYCKVNCCHYFQAAALGEKSFRDHTSRASIDDLILFWRVVTYCIISSSLCNFARIRLFLFHFYQFISGFFMTSDLINKIDIAMLQYNMLCRDQ